MLVPAPNSLTAAPRESATAIRRGASVPAWVATWLGRDEAAMASPHDSSDVEVIVSDAWTFAQVRVADMARASAEELDAAVFAAYGQLASILRASPHAHPIRFWNYVPRLLEELRPGHNRYMTFNAARHRAFEHWLATEEIQPRLVAASAVDAFGDDFVVHLVAGYDPVAPVENARQCPAYRYSARYGPVPPSFARGSVIHAATPIGSPTLITAGTASVVGEETLHADNLHEQLRETELNLASLVESAMVAAAPATGNGHALSRAQAMRRFQHVRAYFSNAEDQSLLEERLPAMFPAARQIELVPATLCRPGLIVEIEGIADLGPASQEKGA